MSSGVDVVNVKEYIQKQWIIVSMSGKRGHVFYSTFTYVLFVYLFE